MTNEELKTLQDKFFSDPDWALMEKLIRLYIDPLKDCVSIDVSMSNDQIATEVRGRQISYESMEKFLSDSGVLKPRIIRNQPGFN